MKWLLGLTVSIGIWSIGLPPAFAADPAPASVPSHMHTLPHWMNDDSYRQWYQEFLDLNWQMLNADRRHQRENTVFSLIAYQISVEKCLDNALALYWVYHTLVHPLHLKQDENPVLHPIADYLRTMVERLMAAAEQYAKLGLTEMGRHLAANILTEYPAAAIHDVRNRAEAFLAASDSQLKEQESYSLAQH